MKNLLILSILIISVSACGQKQTEQEKTKFQSYGEAFEQINVKDISNLPNLMSVSDSVALTLTGTIEKTCAVKGCWMQVQTGTKNNLRVTFKDYGFFVPKTGVDGKQTIIQGYCVKQETSVDELRHYAKDAGEPEEYIAAITKPKTEFSFVASGVIIED